MAFPTLMKSQFAWLLFCIAFILLEACSSDDIPQPFDCEGSTLDLIIESVQGTSNCNATDGSIMASATGGEGPYAYSLNSLGPQTNGNFTSLSAGIYTVTVTDSHQCTAKMNNVSVTATGFTISAEVTPDNSCLDGSGTVTLHASDATPPYQYKLGDGNYTESNLFSALQEGEHTISVKDNSNCEVSLNVTVPRGNSGVSWEQEILPIVKASCALSGCHDGLLRPDLSKYEKAHFYANLMKEYTLDRSMPFEGSITQDQIDLIACWVDDGAPEN